MHNITYKNFIYLTREEEKIVLRWRNSDRVRLKMNNQSIIKYGDHIKWIRTLKTRQDCVYYLFYVDNVPVGVFDITDIDSINETCYVGSYIGDTEYLGYGVVLDHFGCTYAYEKFGISKLWARVLKTNQRAYKMHKRVFAAKDMGETDTEYLIYWEKSDYEKYGKQFEDYLKAIFELKSVEWID